LRARAAWASILGSLGPAGLLGLGVLGLAAPAAARDRGADGVFEQRESSHFVLYQDVDLDRAGGWGGSVDFERTVLQVLEAGYDRLDDRLGLRPRGRLTVVVHDPGIFDRRFAGLFPYPAAGFYGGTIHVRGDTVVTAPLQRTLLHELVHAALDAEAPSLVLPAWLNEGLAEHFEAGATGRPRLTAGEWERLARAARDGAIPPLSAYAAPSFGRLDARSAALAYLYSRGLVDHVARRRGDRELARLVRELVRTGDLERAFRRTTRATPGEHDAAFRRELRGR
jgi:hypothetical protein